MEMNPRLQTRYWLTAVTVLGILAANIALAVPKARIATSASNPPNLKSETTRSVFHRTEACDPFFPKPIPATPTNSLWGLKLQGISGHGHAKLAIINNRTFAEGEDGRVTRGAQTVSIRCLEIRVDSVLIQIHEPPLRGELRFPPAR